MQPSSNQTAEFYHQGSSCPLCISTKFHKRYNCLVKNGFWFLLHPHLPVFLNNYVSKCPGVAVNTCHHPISVLPGTKFYQSSHNLSSPHAACPSVCFIFLSLPSCSLAVTTFYLNRWSNVQFNDLPSPHHSKPSFKLSLFLFQSFPMVHWVKKRICFLSQRSPRCNPSQLFWPQKLSFHFLFQFDMLSVPKSLLLSPFKPYLSHCVCLEFSTEPTYPYFSYPSCDIVFLVKSSIPQGKETHQVHATIPVSTHTSIHRTSDSDPLIFEYVSFRFNSL